MSDRVESLARALYASNDMLTQGWQEWSPTVREHYMRDALTALSHLEKEAEKDGARLAAATGAAYRKMLSTGDCALDAGKASSWLKSFRESSP